MIESVRDALRRSGRWLKLFFGTKVDAGAYYDLLGAHVLGPAEGMPLVNMGYWAETPKGRPASLAQAVEAMFTLVAEGAAVCDDDGLVLDAGCGFGTNAIHLARRGARRVVGLNLSRGQLAVGERLVAEAGLSARVEMALASATAMPFADGEADKVVSVEAAFHFDPRAAFFREAARVLRPGGILSLVDIAAPAPRTLWYRGVFAWARRGLQIPLANVGGLEDVRSALAAAGFDVLVCEQIRGDVFLPFRRWFFTQPLRDILHYNVAYMAASAAYFLYPWEYLRIIARKPAGTASIPPPSPAGA